MTNEDLHKIVDPDSTAQLLIELRRREFLQKIVATTTLLFLSRTAFPFSQIKLQAGAALPSAPRMAAAAEAILKSLSPEQRGESVFSLDDNERQNWGYVPRSRAGVPLKQLDTSQRQLVTALLTAGLSERGLNKATTIISLETVLRELEGSDHRDPNLYYLTLFAPTKSGLQAKMPWGWRFEGHHLSLNYTIINEEHIAVTPSFFGSNPAEVRHGEKKGLRALSQEEDLARTLITSLDGEQRRVALISESAPGEILTGSSRKAEPPTPAGIRADSLTEKQKDVLMSLLNEYLANMPPDIAAARLERLRASGFGNIAFAWAGGSTHGQPHYYRVQGPSFLIEYDNTQNNANHIHSVWRDFSGDFGLDVLAKHYKDAHH